LGYPSQGEGGGGGVGTLPPPAAPGGGVPQPGGPGMPPAPPGQGAYMFSPAQLTAPATQGMGAAPGVDPAQVLQDLSSLIRRTPLYSFSITAKLTEPISVPTPPTAA